MDPEPRAAPDASDRTPDRRHVARSLGLLLFVQGTVVEGWLLLCRPDGARMGSLVGVALVTKETQWEQLQWLVLLPLIALFLNEPRRTVTRPRHIGFLAVATVVAILLGVLIVVFHRLGWTLGEIETLNQDAQDVTGLIDFALFVMSVTGLLRIHRLALSRAEEEVALLRSMLSVCAWCGRLKDADEGWVSIERYMTKHTTTLLSHGICPACEARLQAEVAT